MLSDNIIIDELTGIITLKFDLQVFAYLIMMFFFARIAADLYYYAARWVSRKIKDYYKSKIKPITK